jgi:hypothetical protein
MKYRYKIKKLYEELREIADNWNVQDINNIEEEMSMMWSGMTGKLQGDQESVSRILKELEHLKKLQLLHAISKI